MDLSLEVVLIATAIIHFFHFYLLKKQGAPEKETSLAFGVFYLAAGLLLINGVEKGVILALIIPIIGLISFLLNWRDSYAPKWLNATIILLNIISWLLAWIHFND